MGESAADWQPRLTRRRPSRARPNPFIDMSGPAGAANAAHASTISNCSTSQSDGRNGDTVAPARDPMPPIGMKPVCRAVRLLRGPNGTMSPAVSYLATVANQRTRTMFKQVLFGATAAVAIASASLVAATPAQAAHFGIYVNPGYAPDDSGCWRWSRHWQHWVWICQQDYEQGYYQQPYYSSPSPFFGFSFGDNGDRGDRPRSFEVAGPQPCAPVPASWL